MAIIFSFQKKTASKKFPARRKRREIHEDNGIYFFSLNHRYQTNALLSPFFVRVKRFFFAFAGSGNLSNQHQ